MDLSTLSHGVHKRKLKKRVGRGIGTGHGKTGSRRTKGQYASAGAELPRSIFEGGQMPLFRKIPKRGFSHGLWDKKFHTVNVGDLNGFAEGTLVDQKALDRAGVAKGPADGVRILGTGDLKVKLVIKAHHFSKSALEKIQKAGGTAEVIPPAKKPVRNKMKPRR